MAVSVDEETISMATVEEATLLLGVNKEGTNALW
jgi:hypothetical protein